MNRRRGSILILVTILTVVIGGLTAALLSAAFTYYRASREALNREQAFRAADSGAGYYMVKVAAQPAYFTLNPAPHAAKTMGSSSFELESAQTLGVNNQWQIRLRGLCDGVSYRLNAVIGHRRIQIPNGVVAVGTGAASSVVLALQAGSRVASYDPSLGPYDPLNPGEEGNLAAKGSVTLTGSTTVHGDVTVTGTASVDSFSSITGTKTQGAPDISIEDIDPIVTDAMQSSQTSNNNALLTGVFGLQWRPVLGLQNYGDLIVTTPGTYVIPSGTYRFRKFEVHNGATVVFDTRVGASKLIYVGSGAGTGTGNDLIVTGSSAVQVNPGSTTNGLLTVLGTDCDFTISSSSIFGQALGNPDNSGYSQIISLGGNSSSDDIQVTGGSKVYGRLYAAAHFLTLDQSSWYGSALARKLNIKNSTFAVDVGSLGGTLVHPSDYEILARWPGTI